jgi:hypothetical protein
MSMRDNLENIIDATDGYLELVVAAQCCWSGELRIGLAQSARKSSQKHGFLRRWRRKPR